MELIADRFVVHEGRAVDLGSGDEVLLITSSAGGAAEQRRWALRCQRFANIHHPSIARLLDFGALGEARRFEAWRAGGVWNGARAVAAHALSQANMLLRAPDATTTSAGRIHTWNAQPVIVPGPEAGFDVAARGRCRSVRSAIGLRARAHPPRRGRRDRGAAGRPGAPRAVCGGALGCVARAFARRRGKSRAWHG